MMRRRKFYTTCPATSSVATWEALLAFISGNLLGGLIFQVLPQVLAQGGKPNVAAFKIARLLGRHVGEEQLRRRARLIQDLIHTVGPVARAAQERTQNIRRDDLRDRQRRRRRRSAWLGRHGERRNRPH
jgi:hypothetical protein